MCCRWWHCGTELQKCCFSPVTLHQWTCGASAASSLRCSGEGEELPRTRSQHEFFRLSYKSDFSNWKVQMTQGLTPVCRLLSVFGADFLERERGRHWESCGELVKHPSLTTSPDQLEVVVVVFFNYPCIHQMFCFHNEITLNIRTTASDLLMYSILTTVFTHSLTCVRTTHVELHMAHVHIAMAVGIEDSPVTTTWYQVLSTACAQ